MADLECHQVYPDPIDNWDTLRKLYHQYSEEMDGWYFRGQPYEPDEENQKPNLQTSLERGIKRFYPDLSKAREIEYRLLRDFKRRCPHGNQYRPPSRDKIGWLALLRHYGGPTRLLDWTYSFWNAVYFAIDHAKPKPNKPTYEIWALNAPALQNTSEGKFNTLANCLKKHGSNSIEEGEKIFQIKKLGIWTMNSINLFDRLVAQQGVFILPLDITQTLNNNLNEMNPSKTKIIWRFTISPTVDELKKFYKELHRMNISHATMYPGIEGLARFQSNAIGMEYLYKYETKNLGNSPL